MDSRWLAMAETTILCLGCPHTCTYLPPGFLETRDGHFFWSVGTSVNSATPFELYRREPSDVNPTTMLFLREDKRVVQNALSYCLCDMSTPVSRRYTLRNLVLFLCTPHVETICEGALQNLVLFLCTPHVETICEGTLQNIVLFLCTPYVETICEGT